MQQIIEISTNKGNCLVNITRKIIGMLEKSEISTGMVNVFVHGATAVIMILDN